MIATSFRRRRTAWLRYATTAAFILLAAVVGHHAECTDDWAGLVLLPGLGLQLLGAVFSLGMAVVAWVRFACRDALAEAGVAILMLSSIIAAPVVMGLFMSGGCE